MIDVTCARTWPEVLGTLLSGQDLGRDSTEWNRKRALKIGKGATAGRQGPC